MYVVFFGSHVVLQMGIFVFATSVGMPPAAWVLHGMIVDATRKQGFKGYNNVHN